MLVSLNKNTWLWQWIYNTVDPDNSIREYLITAFSKTRPEEIKNRLALGLAEKGYTVKITSGNDIIISMTEEEYTFLRLKYE